MKDQETLGLRKNQAEKMQALLCKKNQYNMAKSKIIYEDRPTVYAKFDHPQSQDYIEYKSIIQIKDSGKQPVTIQLEFTDTPPFALMPPR